MATSRAPPPVPSWVVLDHFVHEFNADQAVQREGRRPEWAAIKCASKKAYGCGEHGQAAVEGMSLYVRLVDGRSDLSSALAIAVTDEAMKSVRAQIKLGGRSMGYRMVGNRPVLTTTLSTINGNLVVVRLRFDRGLLMYYLVYDLTDASLAMIPFLATPFELASQVRPLPARLGAVGGDYALVLMATDKRRRLEDSREVLCVLPKSEALDGFAPPWQGKHPRFPREKTDLFRADVTFTFAGKLFWADLTRGIMFCDSHDVLSVSGEVDFGYVSLPTDLRRIDRYEGFHGPMELRRTVGAAGGSLKLVSIDEYSPPAGSAKVTVWTLDLAHLSWSKGSMFILKSLWAQAAYKKAGLPNTVPEWPFLRPDEGGMIYFTVLNRRKKPEDPMLYHVCGVDMLHGKKLVMSRKISNFNSRCSEPIALPVDAFENKLCSLGDPSKMVPGIVLSAGRPK